MDRREVVVVGAGPTGLLLASELALQGVDVVVLDRLAEPDQTIKAGSVNVASAEILDRRGLLPAAEQKQAAMLDRVAAFGDSGPSSRVRDYLQGPRRFPVAGHFAGMLFRPELVDQTDPRLVAHVAAANGVLVPQHDVELVLAEHADRLGVELRRGVSVIGVHSIGADLDDDADVVVETDAGEIRAGWVVAADGGRSVIRKQLGVDFVGTDPQLVGYQAIADIDDPADLRRGWSWTRHGVYTYGPVPGRILVARFGPQPADRDAPVSLEELQDVVREVTETDVTLTGIQGRATRWSDNARQASSYRRGRVLLAGDAAHVHSPFSGQGLNLGLGDATNLGWKLAATVQGQAPEGLLDTYESERHPIAAQVLDWTRAQVALMRGDAWTEQLRHVVETTMLGTPATFTDVVARTSGIEQRYEVADDEPDVDAVVGSFPGSVVGDSPLSGGGRLADHAHDGRFVLVDRSPEGRYVAVVNDGAERVVGVEDPDSAGPSLLVRPDGVIVWTTTTDESASDAEGRLAIAVRRWVA